MPLAPLDTSPSPRGPSRRAARLALAALLLSSPAAAEQAQHFASIGLLGSASAHGGEPVRAAFGAEGTFVHYVDHERSLGLGGFLQAQVAAPRHHRFAFGPQINYEFFGLELGSYAETAGGGYATTWGLHAAPFVSLGLVSAAFRVAVPLGTSGAGEPQGTELGLVFTLKAPFPIGGEFIGNILR
jgi:hypothetical protein